ncbi:MAG: hypothetical protein L3K17_03340 [Thermoplasmata archaeon]|nr:hypothetical protein [Thermoplasmata archaeon]
MPEGGHLFSYEARARPKPGMEGKVQAAMQDFADWIAPQPGLVRLLFMKDSETGDLVGVSFWDRKESWEKAMQLSMQASAAEAHNMMAQDFADALQVPFEAHMYDVIWERQGE